MTWVKMYRHEYTLIKMIDLQLVLKMYLTLCINLKKEIFLYLMKQINKNIVMIYCINVLNK